MISNSYAKYYTLSNNAKYIYIYIYISAYDGI